jgi:tetratricopeptide (TPR) repeat protein
MQLPTVGTTLAEPEEAAANAERALALFPLAEPAQRGDPEFYMWWARALRSRSTLAQLRGDAESALGVLRQRLRLVDRAIERFPQHHSLRFERASTLLATGQILDTPQMTSLNQPGAALNAFAAAEAEYQALVSSKPEDSDLYYELGGVADMQLMVLHKLGRLAEAQAAGERAVRWRDQALALKPEHTSYRLGPAGVRNNLASFLLNTGQSLGLLELAQQGEAAMAALEKDDPASPHWKAMRRLFALQWGRAWLVAGQADQAEPRLVDAIDGMAEAREGPLLVRRAIGWLALARAQVALGQEDRGRASAQSAAADLRQRLAEDPADARAAGCLQEATALLAAPPPSAGGAPKTA